MQSRLFIAVFVIAWLVVGTGCDAVNSVRQKLPIPPTSGEILFVDDFSDSESGWQTWSEGESVIAYHEGGLRFIINEPHYDYWSRPGRWYSDVSIETLVTLKNGSVDNDFGLICRFQDDGNFYMFLASSDGYAGIVKVQDGNYQVISGASLEYKPEVARGEAANLLRAECAGSELTFYVNDTKVAVAEDEAFSEGDVGLIAGTYENPGVDILFDHFVALQP